MEITQNGLNQLSNVALVYAITNLDCYKSGKSSMQQYYFPIRRLTSAVNSLGNSYSDIAEQETELTR